MGIPDGFYTYEIIVYAEDETILWSGQVEGQPTKGPDGIPALKLSPNGLPQKLVEILKESTIHKVEWSEAWDIIEEEKTNEK